MPNGIIFRETRKKEYFHYAQKTTNYINYAMKLKDVLVILLFLLKLNLPEDLIVQFEHGNVV